MAQKPWERMEGESAKAFEAFRIYRDMGPERNLRAVGERLGKSRAIIERWSSSNQWVERARAYDNDLERAAHQEALKSVREMQKRHISIAAQLQNKALLALQKTKPEHMKPGELLSFMKEAAKLERETRSDIVESYEKTHGGGSPNSRKGVARSGQKESGPVGGGELDMSNLSDEELVDLERLLEKLHPKRED